MIILKVYKGLKMRIIKDLGKLPPKGKTAGIRKFHYLLVECPGCGEETKMKKAFYLKNKPELCRKCKIGKGNIRHGLSYDKLYYKWKDMVGRCYNQNLKNYKYYGKKGVTVCEEWKTDVFSFRSWAMQSGYKDGLVLDKDILCKKLNITPGVYSPETCQWVTATENQTELTDRLKSETKTSKYKEITYSRVSKTWSARCRQFINLKDVDNRVRGFISEREAIIYYNNFLDSIQSSKPRLNYGK